MCTTKTYNMRGKVFLLFCSVLCLSDLFIGVASLKCKCDICINTNYVCETDGYCFTTTYETKGVIDHQYRCLEKEISIPIYNPLGFLQYSPISRAQAQTRCLDLKNIPVIATLHSGASTDYCNETVVDSDHPKYQKRVSACCNNADFCNDVKFDLPTYTPMSEPPFWNLSALEIMVIIVAPTALICTAIIVYYFCRTSKQSRGGLTSSFAARR
ncbi:hypothetical protein WA026_014679 [Henosepilachna vigintioctopunctata]|uniref:Activin types I and II receptor domain-containing protein n=1 Tax=Henosepilachna vigintioctopunctata TaxID=420089 RepID=A0AAW1V6X0_9CUCU